MPSEDPLTAPSAPTAFVTGATGLLGHNLVRALLTQGHHVMALSRSAAKAQRQFAGLPVQHVIGDMADVQAFAHHLRGVDVLYHAAAYFRDSYKGGSHRDALMATNVHATRALMQAAHAQGVRRMVHVSSIAVLDGLPGQPIDETMSRDVRRADDYYLSKILAEEEVRTFLATHPDFWAAFVLPGWMHGPGDAGPTSAGQTVLDFLQRKLPAVPPGTFSIVDARDVAQAAIAVARQGRRGERYLAAGRHTTMREFMTLLHDVTGVQPPRRNMPLPMLHVVAWLSELAGRLSGRPVLLSAATVRLIARELDRTHFDHRKSEAELGVRWRPLVDTLRDEVAWLQAHVLAPQPASDSPQRRTMAPR